VNEWMEPDSYNRCPQKLLTSWWRNIVACGKTMPPELAETHTESLFVNLRA
jgi:hypothetical protein